MARDAKCQGCQVVWENKADALKRQWPNIQRARMPRKPKKQRKPEAKKTKEALDEARSQAVGAKEARSQ